MDVNSDNDNLPDVVEKFGLMFNGTLIETNIYKEDTDDDGLWDDEEVIFDRTAFIAGLEKGVCTEGITFFANPTQQHSDTDGIGDAEDSEPLTDFDDRFILVDDINYYPSIDFMDYNKLGTGATEFDEHGVVGEDGRDYCYNSKLPTVSDYGNYVYLRAIETGAALPLVTNVAGKVAVDEWVKMKHSSGFLEWFLDNTGDLLVLTSSEMKEVVNTDAKNLYHYMYGVNALLDVCESTVVDGETLVFSSNTDNNFKVACYTQKHCSEGHYPDNEVDITIDEDTGLDWSFSIGEAFGGMTCEVTKNGNTYTMKYKYCLMDYYEWGYHVDGGDKNQHMLHESGLAREFPIFGCLTNTITWEKGERISTASEAKTLIDDSNLPGDI